MKDSVVDKFMQLIIKENSTSLSWNKSESWWNLQYKCTWTAMHATAE